MSSNSFFLSLLVSLCFGAAFTQQPEPLYIVSLGSNKCLTMDLPNSAQDNFHVDGHRIFQADCIDHGLQLWYERLFYIWRVFCYCFTKVHISILLQVSMRWHYRNRLLYSSIAYWPEMPRCTQQQPGWWTAFANLSVLRLNQSTLFKHLSPCHFQCTNWQVFRHTKWSRHSCHRHWRRTSTICLSFSRESTISICKSLFQLPKHC
jgi:hypothetical protein